MDAKELIFMFVGGLGIFLFGIKYMSDGLEKAAGDRLSNILERMTSNPLKSVLAGTLVTAIIQSSSGTTVLTVGLVNAGLLNLRQAIGIIMGANIGTTITGFIIGFKISNFALPIIAIGVIMLIFFKKKNINNLGEIVFGFGMLFLGLNNMSDAMRPLRSAEVFTDLMQTLSDQPVLGILVGTVFTMIVQSSSATIGVLQTLAESGSILVDQAYPILFGDNIGTTITAALAAIGTSVAAKRAALSHILFNIGGTLIFLPLLSIGLYPYVVDIIAGGLNAKMQIAWAHGIFNVSNALIQLPFIAVLAYIVTKLIPGKNEELTYGVKFLDKRFLSSPSVAISQVRKELVHMGTLAKKTLVNGIDFFFSGDESKSKKALQKEDIIDDLDDKITAYLVKINQQSTLTKIQSNQSSLYLQITNDIERIGDHSINIVEMTQYAYRKNITFTETALSQLEAMFKLTVENCGLAIECYENKNSDLASQILENEDAIDEMEKVYRKSHMKRLNSGECTGSAGVLFLDIISNLERISDHCLNISQAVVEEVNLS